jgi:hypothetical protein
LAAIAALAGCQFRDALAIDAAADGPSRSDAADAAPAIDAAPPSLCASDPALPLCLSFDQLTAGATAIANEGTASNITVQLTAVTPVTDAPSHTRAAGLGSSSEIYVPAMPASTEVTSIETIEMWLRMDAEPTADLRTGLLDNAVGPTGLSLFYYNDINGRRFRCVLASDDVYTPPITWALGSWHEVACTCDPTANTLSIYLDGQIAISALGCAAAAINADGLTIGQDLVTPDVPVDDELVGAIDGVRLWSRVLTAVEICRDAGGASCLD